MPHDPATVHDASLTVGPMGLVTVAGPKERGREQQEIRCREPGVSAVGPFAAACR